MEYEVVISDDAKYHIEQFRKSGQKIITKKIDDLLKELKIHPKTGTGHPEQLKGLPGRWSRRITGKHRLIYKIQEEVVVVIVLSAFGHYD